MFLLKEFWGMIRNPAEYGQVLILIGVFAAFCGLVTAVAVVAWRGTYTWGRRRRRLNLSFTLGATVLSLLALFCLNAEFYFERDDLKRTIELKWIFVLPAVLSAIAQRRFFVMGRDSSEGITANPV